MRSTRPYASARGVVQTPRAAVRAGSGDHPSGGRAAADERPADSGDPFPGQPSTRTSRRRRAPGSASLARLVARATADPFGRGVSVASGPVRRAWCWRWGRSGNGCLAIGRAAPATLYEPTTALCRSHPGRLAARRRRERGGPPRVCSTYWTARPSRRCWREFSGTGRTALAAPRCVPGAWRRCDMSCAGSSR